MMAVCISAVEAFTACPSVREGIAQLRLGGGSLDGRSILAAAIPAATISIPIPVPAAAAVAVAAIAIAIHPRILGAVVLLAALARVVVVHAGAI